MAATGAVGQRLDKLDESFLMALDYMIQQADRDDKVLTCECPCNPALSIQFTLQIEFIYTPKVWWLSSSIDYDAYCQIPWLISHDMILSLSIIELVLLLITSILQQRWLLEVIKDVVLAQLSQKFPSQVSVLTNICASYGSFHESLIVWATEVVAAFCSLFCTMHLTLRYGTTI